jgi:YD repeat-containing protein
MVNLNTSVLSAARRRLKIGCLLLLALPALCRAEQITYSYDNLNRVIRAEYGNGAVVEYSYDAAGNRLSRAVTGANQMPVAEAGTTQTASVGTLIVLNGGASYDPDNAPSPLTYKWVQKHGPGITLAGADTAAPSFTPTQAGAYEFGLTVYDGAAHSKPSRVRIDVTP